MYLKNISQCFFYPFASPLHYLANSRQQDEISERDVQGLNEVDKLRLTRAFASI